MPSSATAFSLYRNSARSVGAKSAAALAAGAAALAAAGSAEAQAVSYQFTSGNVASPGHNVYLNFSQGTVSSSPVDSNFFKIYIQSITPSDQVSSYFDGHFSFGGGTNYVAGTGGSPTVLTKFAAGDTISSVNHNIGAALNSYNGPVIPAWSNVTDGFIAVSDYMNSKRYYGWVEVNTNADASVITVDAFGYNHTAGAPSIAGDGLAPVPEPAASAALLAAGAAGVALYRQRKGKARAAAVAV